MSAINQLRLRIFRIWRGKRHERFLQELAPRVGESMIDVGGYPTYWTAYPMPVKRIDCVNLHQYDWPAEQYPEHNIGSLIGDGCALTMPDQCYDIAFSNSVIEHVGDLAAQKKFALEMRRVGRRLWVQTPAYECPLEPHFLAPFIHWLSPAWRKRLARNFTLWGWMERPTKTDVEELVDFTQLLTKGQMREMFPDCEIITERLLWVFPKSHVAIRR